MNVSLPLCGVINVNGFIGDAVFRTAQGPCTISRRLARACKTKEDDKEEMMNNVNEREILVQLKINNNFFEIPMRIDEAGEVLNTLFYIKCKCFILLRTLLQKSEDVFGLVEKTVADWA